MQGVSDILAKGLESTSSGARNSALHNTLQPMQREAAFDAALQRFSQTGGGQVSEARQAARDFVSTALITPLLSELREQPLQANLFHGGTAEDAFRQRFDQIVGDRIVAELDQRGGFPLIDQLHEQITQKAKAQAAQEINILA
ncbi:MAG: hypothetical protein MI741_16430 [Rhodospirillales bacterium]|nr:hypothetical protein [Rhodospirillales bacterium]